MPVQACQANGKPGYKWGQQGKCYTYTPGNRRQQAEARLSAEMQGHAIEARRGRDNA